MSHHSQATEALACARSILQHAIDGLAARCATNGRVDIAALDEEQLLAYDLAHTASTLEACDAMLAYAHHGEFEAQLAYVFVARALTETMSRIAGRTAHWNCTAEDFVALQQWSAPYRDPSYLVALAEALPKSGTGPTHLDAEFELVRETFRRFASDKIRPFADDIHRGNLDIPESIIGGLAEIGGFGLSVPEAFGGFASDTDGDYLGMVVATEELSWGSLGAGGSLITRPEIVTRALLAGGTDEQRARFLPGIASGELMNGIMVTEPDYGSDVANITTSATRVSGGWRISGTKTWCTFAGRANVLLLLARTNPDRSLGHRGLTLFLIEKEPQPGHAFTYTCDSGSMQGRAIDTLGYRGMHSFEVAFDNWFVPDHNVVGGDAGIGRGFYLQMEGFENGRLQTAARAVGVMQAAFEAALEYATNRMIFGQSEFSYQLTKIKLAEMAATIAAGRQFSYRVAQQMTHGDAALEASMVKAFTCRCAEWVTREAMQLHGGMGYAEEYPVSRYFVDARVLSIFEGADETLCLRVIARGLIERAASQPAHRAPQTS
jgi:(2S)-methylsuccinyl-CoA dehydrogenase